MSYCPLIRERCKGEQCSFWISKTQEGDNKCAIYWIGLTMASIPKERPEAMGPEGEPQIEAEIPPQVLEELNSKTPEQIARELIDFAKKEFPESLEMHPSHIPYNIKKLFWTKKGIGPHAYDPDATIKMLKAESLAEIEWEKAAGGEEAPQFKQKSVEELGKEIATHLRSQSPELLLDTRHVHMVVEQFWNERYPAIRELWAPEIRLKRQNAELVAAKMLEEDKKRYLNTLIEKMVDWGKKKGLTKLTRSAVKSFLMQEGIKVGQSAEEVLYYEAKLKFS